MRLLGILVHRNNAALNHLVSACGAVGGRRLLASRLPLNGLRVDHDLLGLVSGSGWVYALRGLLVQVDLTLLDGLALGLGGRLLKF